MLVLICQILPEIIERRVLKEVVQYDLHTYTHPKCEGRVGCCAELNLHHRIRDLCY